MIHSISLTFGLLAAGGFSTGINKPNNFKPAPNFKFARRPAVKCSQWLGNFWYALPILNES